jgi:hypothetical protein
MIMDPNVLLKEIGELRDQAARGEDVRRAERELRWKVTDLFEWLAGGGFAPDWTQWISAVDQDDDDLECPGHESLSGGHMGESIYCDGSCRG